MRCENVEKKKGMLDENWKNNFKMYNISYTDSYLGKKVWKVKYVLDKITINNYSSSYY